MMREKLTEILVNFQFCFKALDLFSFLFCHWVAVGLYEQVVNITYLEGSGENRCNFILRWGSNHTSKAFQGVKILTLRTRP